MTALSGIPQIELTAIKVRNLDTECYRGSAPLWHLAKISQTDVFDQATNKEGLQRDLSPKHASEAYDYVFRAKNPEYPRAYPEVVLNVRDKNVLEIQPVEDSNEFLLRFNVSAMEADKVFISRVDGNHRLYYAAGDDRRDPLLADAPFQIHVGLKRKQERSLFVDINGNQKGLNTSHLAVMQSRLTDEEKEIKDHLDRWIATKLSEDSNSPWHGLIHLGGSKSGSRQQSLTRVVNFASIQGGIKKLLSKSQYIHDLTDPNAQYVVIRNYWHAVKKVFAEEWAKPKDYLLLKNIGVWSLSIFGGSVIDRSMPKSKIDIDDLVQYIEQARNTFDWRKDATGSSAVSGMSGNRAAMIIAATMSQELTDESETSFLKELQEKLKGTGMV